MFPKCVKRDAAEQAGTQLAGQSRLHSWQCTMRLWKGPPPHTHTHTRICIVFSTDRPGTDGLNLLGILSINMPHPVHALLPLRPPPTSL